MIMKIMRAYWYKPFTMQLIIFLLYVGITCYQFVQSEAADPIGTGLRQWLFIIIHVLLVVIWYFIKRRSYSDRQVAGQILLMNILGIMIPLGVYSLFSDAIWSWLWSLR